MGGGTYVRWDSMGHRGCTGVGRHIRGAGANRPTRPSAKRWRAAACASHPSASPAWASKHTPEQDAKSTCAYDHPWANDSHVL